MNWEINASNKRTPSLRKPILIEGLPGIGNVGKIAVDFLIDELKATKMCDFFSYSFPHTVFVREDNLVELPEIALYYKKLKNSKNDLLLLAGDVQPIDEFSTYEFSEILLNYVSKFNPELVITLGGIGLPNIPKSPKVYITGTSKKIIECYKRNTNASNQLFGVVGPIIGVSGLLLGMAKRKKISAVSLLAETYSHPMYLGIKGAREILKILKKKLNLKLNVKKMDKEIAVMEADMMKTTQSLSRISKQTLKRFRGKVGKEISYIG